MNYHNITHDDMLNGDGLRVVLWVAGCSHHCKGCQNPVTWDPNDGLPFDEQAKEELFRELRKDYISGVTFSGGDPFYISNRRVILDLSKEIKETFPNKTIWAYTGYSWDRVRYLKGIGYIDVLVDGPFLKDFADVNYHWAGSTNQRVIDVKKSIENGDCVLIEEGGK